MLSHTRYGGNRKTLLKMHKTMILPILDYGSFLYHSANSNVLQTLNVINHSGIRLCTGAFRTSPFISLIVDSGLSTLNFKREKQSLKFFQKVLSFTSHPLYSFAHNENLKIKVNVINHFTSGLKIYYIITIFLTIFC